MSFKIKALPQFAKEYQNIAKFGDEKKLNRIDRLIENACQTPFSGLGKPEALRFGLSGLWSRRITQKDRLIYSVEGDTIVLHQCLGHYDE